MSEHPLNLFGDDPDFERMAHICASKQSYDKIVEMQEKLLETTRQVISDDNILQIIDERVKNLSVQEIRSMNREQVNKFFDIEGFTLGIDFDDKMREDSFKKDFLVFARQGIDMKIELDKAHAKLKFDLESHQDELQGLVSSFSDMNTMMIAKMREMFETTPDPIKKKKFGIMIESMEDAFNLTRLYKNYSSLRPRNQLADYLKDPDRIYSKYMKAVQTLGLKMDISKFTGLEDALLPEKYHKYPDLFLFLVMKYIGFGPAPTKESEGIFITQLLYNINKILKCNMTQEEGETFVSNIIKVLDIIYNDEGKYAETDGFKTVDVRPLNANELHLLRKIVDLEYGGTQESEPVAQPIEIDMSYIVPQEENYHLNNEIHHDTSSLVDQMQEAVSGMSEDILVKCKIPAEPEQMIITFTPSCNCPNPELHHHHNLVDDSIMDLSQETQLVDDQILRIDTSDSYRGVHPSPDHGLNVDDINTPVGLGITNPSTPLPINYIDHQDFYKCDEVLITGIRNEYAGITGAKFPENIEVYSAPITDQDNEEIDEKGDDETNSND